MKALDIAGGPKLISGITLFNKHQQAD